MYDHIIMKPSMKVRRTTEYNIQESMSTEHNGISHLPSSAFISLPIILVSFQLATLDRHGASRLGREVGLSRHMGRSGDVLNSPRPDVLLISRRTPAHQVVAQSIFEGQHEDDLWN